MPTNRRLMAVRAETADAGVRTDIVTWGRLHAGRTALGMAAVVAYVVAML